MKALLARVSSNDVWNSDGFLRRYPNWMTRALSSVVAATDGEPPRVVSGYIDDEKVARLIVLTDSFLASLSSPWTEEVGMEDYAVTVTALRRLTSLQVATSDEIRDDEEDPSWPRWMHLRLRFDNGTELQLPAQEASAITTRRELAQFLPTLLAHVRG